MPEVAGASSAVSNQIKNKIAKAAFAATRRPSPSPKQNAKPTEQSHGKVSERATDKVADSKPAAKSADKPAEGKKSDAKGMLTLIKKAQDL